MSFERCFLKENLEMVFINDKGIAKIEPRWDEEAYFSCPICGGTRHGESIDARGYRRLTPCPGEYTLRRIERFNLACIPGRFKDVTFDSYNTSVIGHSATSVVGYMNKVRKYQTGMKGILFEGGPGTGKTHLLCATARYLTLELGVSVRYVDYSQLLSDIRASYGRQDGFGRQDAGPTEADFIASMVNIPVLLLDELGKGRAETSDFENRIIDAIINGRYQNPDLTTIFASNFRDRVMSGYDTLLREGLTSDSIGNSKAWQDYLKKFSIKRSDEEMTRIQRIFKAEHLENRVSERVMSRIFEMANPVYIDAGDYRRRVIKS